jgi:FeS assembly SUF system regulator
MIRITKATDYGILLLSHFARRPETVVLNAKDLAALTRIPLPMVGKILKTLAHAGLLESHRGARGGYTLKRPPDEISLTQVIHAIEGPVALTECGEGPGVCSLEWMCPIQSNWMRINEAVRHALTGVTLSDIARPSQWTATITGGRGALEPIQAGKG